MGTNVPNHFLAPHVPNGGACTGYRFVIHQGDANNQVRFSESPDCTVTVRDEIIAAAGVSQSAFNTKLGNTWSTWNSTLSSNDRVNLRTCALAY